MNNPFSVVFGKKPLCPVDRPMQTEELVRLFTDEPPASRTVMLAGVRGSGRTVLLREVAGRLAESGWTIASVNPASEPVTATERAVGQAEESESAILVTMDDVVYTPPVREALGLIRDAVRGGRRIFLLMTGTKDVLYRFRDDEALDFLSDVSCYEPGWLDREQIRENYRRVFDLPPEKAELMAALTEGFPIAYQVLGYLYGEHSGADMDELIYEYDEYLAEYVYEELWAGLSSGDQKVLRALAGTEDGAVAELKERADMSAGELSVYRERLARKGLVDAGRYGYLRFALPRLDIFIREK